MLVELQVNNYALIDDLKIEFSSGLNVLSGETGAGKSIVIGAINLLLGERAAVDQIRQGQDKAYIEGILNCEKHKLDPLLKVFSDAGIDWEDDLIIAREIYKNGRSVARVNGRAVPVSFLKDLGRFLVDLHGQHQHQSLLRPEEHLQLLDLFGGEKIKNARVKTADLYHKWQKLKKDLNALGESKAERERRIDVVQYQFTEIREANLNPGEDEELAEREKILANAEKISTLANQAYSELYAGEENGSDTAVIDRLGRITRLIGDAAEIDKSLGSLIELLSSASAQLEEVSHELRDYSDKIEFQPDELISLQDRVNKINTLKRKYGPNLEDVIAFADNLEVEIERLKNSETLAAELEEEIKNAEKLLSAESNTLRLLRQEVAVELEKQLQVTLKELALPNARFKISIKPKLDYSTLGMDEVEFLFSANKGEEVRPLVKIISGGEMSRVMLALKTIFAREDRVPTLIFDEVDSGVGGATVQSVAEKLAQLAKFHQVMCVTHSPQIAAMADTHFSLYKETVKNRTLTRAAKLGEDEKRREIARMLDGASIDNVSLQHVDNLLERARLYKDQVT